MEQDQGTKPKPTIPTKQRSRTDPNIVPPSGLLRQRQTRSSSPSPSDSASRGRSNHFHEPKHSPHRLHSPSPSKKNTFDYLYSAIYSNRINVLHDYLKDPYSNPNIQNHKGIFLLQSCISMDKEAAIYALLCDPRTNSLIRNEEGVFPCTYKSSIAIESMINLRTTLDHILYAFLVTHKMCFEKPLKEKKLKQEIPSLLLKFSSSAIPSYASSDFVFDRIKSQLDSNRKILETDYQKFSTEKNYRGIYGDTLVHLYARLGNPKLMTLIINADITFNVRNKIAQFTNHMGFLPQGLLCIMETTTGSMREDLFMRSSLQSWALEAVEEALIDYPTIDALSLKPESKFVLDIIDHINRHAEKVKKSQNSFGECDDQEVHDRNLPSKTSDIPDYATTEFFLALIKHHLQERKPNKITFSTVYSPEQSAEAWGSNESHKMIIKDQIKRSLDPNMKTFFSDLEKIIAKQALENGIDNEAFNVQIFKEIVNESFEAKKKELLQKYTILTD